MVVGMKKIILLIGLLLWLPMQAQSVEYRWQSETGEQVNLSSLQGKPLILHFWASWCPPCRGEMPALVKWVAEHPQATVVIVSLDSNKANAQAFFKQQNIKLPLNMGSMSGASALGLRGLPTTLIIDAKGDVTKRHVGDLDWGDQQTSQQVLRWL